MKKIERTVQRTETIVTFEAMDGNTFESETECKKYEDSIRNTIKGKFHQLDKSDEFSAYDYIPNVAYEDDLYILNLKSEQDVNVLNAYLDTIDKNCAKASYEDIGKDVMVVIGYDSCWTQYYGTVEKYLAEVKSDFDKLLDKFHTKETQEESK